MPYRRKIAIKRNSVSRFPLPRIRDMTSERFVFVNTSAIVRNTGEKAAAQSRHEITPRAL
jgi:hypothetical protein